jgi:hypothetical protein
MQVGTQDPAVATSRVSGTPVGTSPPSVRQTPKSLSPLMIWFGESVLSNDQPATFDWLKPTLICVMLGAAANTYTS